MGWRDCVEDIFRGNDVVNNDVYGIEKSWGKEREDEIKGLCDIEGMMKRDREGKEENDGRINRSGYEYDVCEVRRGCLYVVDWYGDEGEGGGIEEDVDEGG